MKKTSNTTTGFTFQPIGHKYFLDGKAMTGVTTILGVIAKPMLIQWAANQACDYIAEHMGEIASCVMKGADGGERVANIIKEAKTAHRKKKEAAGEAGTDVHSQIELLIKDAIDNNKGIVFGQSDNEQVKHFIDWAEANHVKFLASEDRIYSKEWWVAGTCDFLCEMQDELWLGDIKTSSAVYPEHFYQTSAYQKMYEEMGLHQNFKGNIILNLRKDGNFEEKRSISNVDNLLAFQSALNIYRVQQKLQGNII